MQARNRPGKTPSLGVRSAAQRKAGRICPYHPCSATKRGTTFSSESCFLNHTRRYHGAALQRYAREIAEQTQRQRAYGGTRAITGEAMVDIISANPTFLEEGQTEMNRRNNANQAQFEDPVVYESMRVNSCRNRVPVNDFDTTQNDTPDDLHIDDLNTDQDNGPEEYQIHSRREHQTAGKAIERLHDSKKLFPKDCNPFAPFLNPYDFKIGSWLCRANATNDIITDGFNKGIILRSNGDLVTAITSAYTLEERLDKLLPEFGKDSWETDEVRFWADDKKKIQPFSYRDPVKIIQHLFKQPAYRDNLAYKPVQELNEKGERVYSELFSGDWVWEQQDKIPVGGTLVPTLLTSDQTQLTTQVGGLSFWPLFMSVGNLSSTVRNRPSNNAWVLLAQLPIPPKMRKHHFHVKQGSKKLNKEGQCKTDFQRLYKSYKEDAFGAVISKIFAPLNAARKEGIRLECADGFVRMGYPVVAGWLADFQEYNKIYTTTATGCCVCEISEAQLGDNVVAGKRDSEEHSSCLQALECFKMRRRKLNEAKDDKEIFAAYKAVDPKFPKTLAGIKDELQTMTNHIDMAELYFSVRQSKPIDNALWKTGVAHIQDVWKPDLLHTIYEGMAKHIFEVLEKFLEHHNRMEKFETAWMQIPAFGTTPAPTRSIFEEEQRTGKAMRDAIRQLLPVLVIALDNPTAEEHFEFHDCLAACRYLVDFSLVCQYRYHTETSLGYLQKYLDGFHKHKNVFNPFRRQPNATKNQASRDISAEEDGRDEILEQRANEVTQETRAEVAAEKQKAVSTLQAIAKHLFEYDKPQLQQWLRKSSSEEVFLLEDVLELLEEIATKREIRFLDHGAYWKIPKLHLLSHFGETIRRFGYLQQYSSEVGETLHKGIKEAFRFSSKSKLIPQILHFHTRKFAVRMRELNLESLARDRLYEEEIQEALSLYGNRSDRLLAAKLNRTGLGSIRNSAYYAEQAEKVRAAAEKELAILERSNFDRPISTDAPWFIPPPLPLFPDILKEATGRSFSGRITSCPVGSIKDLSQSFDLPLLADALQFYIESELKYVGGEVEDIVRLPTVGWNNLHITSETVQAVNPLEVHKLVCSGPYKAARKDTPRNDAIVFLHHDEYFAQNKLKGWTSDFGAHRIGMLKSMFQVMIPKREHWSEFLAIGTLSFDARHFEQHSLALVLGLQPCRYDKVGEMIPGALIAKCRIPQRLQGFTQTRNDNLNATHNAQRRHDGTIININTIIRAAQIIPQHDLLRETNEAKMIWTVNNRSDLGMWDMLYAKATEREENSGAVTDTDT